MIGKTYSGESRKMRLWIIYWRFTIDFVASYMHYSPTYRDYTFNGLSQIFSFHLILSDCFRL